MDRIHDSEMNQAAQELAASRAAAADLRRALGRSRSEASVYFGIALFCSVVSFVVSLFYITSPLPRVVYVPNAESTIKVDTAQPRQRDRDALGTAQVRGVLDEWPTATMLDVQP